MDGKRLGAWTLGLLMAPAMAAHADSIHSYDVTDLGAMTVRGMSNAGQVIGEMPMPMTNPYTGRVDQVPRSVIYRGGTTTPVTAPGSDQRITGAVISPGGTIAYPGTQAPSIDLGATAHVIKDGEVRDGGAPTPDGVLAGGGEYSVPRAVNDAGAVVGDYHAYGRWNRAFVAATGPDGRYRPLGLGANGGSTSAANAINNRGVVVGSSDVAGRWKSHAFVGTPSNDIGTLGGQNSMAYGINDAGQVVGASNIGTDWKAPEHPESSYTPEPLHAFLYTAQDGMRDLGTLPGVADSEALAINSLGAAVGDSGGRAVAFAGGEVIDLNTLIPADSGWLLTKAVAINDLGQIAGQGLLDGEARGFLLTAAIPVPEPSSWALFALGAVAWVVHVRRGHRRAAG